jgi:hypothetical protein
MGPTGQDRAQADQGLPAAPPPPPAALELDLSLEEFNDGKPHDHCGIVGIAAGQDVASWLYYGLQMLQHRGQESCGMTTLDG